MKRSIISLLTIMTLSLASVQGMATKTNNNSGKQDNTQYILVNENETPPLSKEQLFSKSNILSTLYQDAQEEGEANQFELKQTITDIVALNPAFVLEEQLYKSYFSNDTKERVKNDFISMICPTISNVLEFVERYLAKKYDIFTCTQDLAQHLLETCGTDIKDEVFWTLIHIADYIDAHIIFNALVVASIKCYTAPGILSNILKEPLKDRYLRASRRWDSYLSRRQALNITINEYVEDGVIILPKEFCKNKPTFDRSSDPYLAQIELAKTIKYNTPLDFMNKDLCKSIKHFAPLSKQYQTLLRPMINKISSTICGVLNCVQEKAEKYRIRYTHQIQKEDFKNPFDQWFKEITDPTLRGVILSCLITLIRKQEGPHNFNKMIQMFDLLDEGYLKMAIRFLYADCYNGILRDRLNINPIRNKLKNNKSAIDLSGVFKGNNDPLFAHVMKFIELAKPLYGCNNTALGLNNNQLTTLPKEIGSLTALTILTLQRNKITAIPAAIGNLTALKGLYLQGNQLDTIATEMLKLTALKKLNLSNNPITINDIPQALRDQLGEGLTI